MKDTEECALGAVMSMYQRYSKTASAAEIAAREFYLLLHMTKLPSLIVAPLLLTETAVQW